MYRPYVELVINSLINIHIKNYAFPSLSVRGAVCVAWGPAGAPTEAGRQDGPQMPEQE